MMTKILFQLSLMIVGIIWIGWHTVLYYLVHLAVLECPQFVFNDVLLLLIAMTLFWLIISKWMANIPA